MTRERRKGAIDMQPRRFFVLLGVSACLALTGPAQAEPLKVGLFKADVTPPIGTPLCNGNCRPAERVDRPLDARGVVLLAGGSPIVLCAVDWVVISNGGYDAWREALADAAATSPDRVVVHCVHQHDAPGCDFTVEELLKPHGLSGGMFDPAFARKAIARTAEAVRKAVDNPRTVTHVGLGRAKVEKVASSRRLLGADGTIQYVRLSCCRNAKVRAEPEGLIDPYLRSLSLWNGEQPIVCMSYYACHPTCNYGRGGIGSEFAGVARERREKAVPGAMQIVFTGAAGNIAVGKYNDGSKGTRAVLAGRLTEAMEAAWGATRRTPIAAGDVAWRVRPTALPVRKSLVENERLEKLENPRAKVKERLRAARDLAFLRRARAGHQVDLSCLRLGPVRVLHMPGELCVEYQLAAQEMRPDAPVLMAAYVDVSAGYICPEIAYSQGGYESSRVSRVDPSVEGVLMRAMHELLR